MGDEKRKSVSPKCRKNTLDTYQFTTIHNSFDSPQGSGYINGLENKHGFPSMQGFFYICEYLGVTPSEFFDDGNQHPIEYRELLKDLDALSEENRRNVLAIVKGLKY